MHNLVFAAFLAALVTASTATFAGPFWSLVLVARPQYTGPVYERTVLLVSPFGADQHYGFIVNRPTVFKLGDLFPDDESSKRVMSPVFLGGPVFYRVLFALVRGAPARGCVLMMPRLCAFFDAPAVERIIATPSARARFFTGFVIWRPGELNSELARGMWHALEPDASLVTREPHGLWEEFVRRAQRAEEMRLTSRSAGARFALTAR
jgi:putative transcriptional regulator